ncbi:MAG: helix-turn-helix domain-containing protein [Niveispirillum sp.]|uniref:helix-turn-helix domain-containing protein n=1 Tax=Niveispirillum sp. TaxID=1917217 RepID=UPI003BA82830
MQLRVSAGAGAGHLPFEHYATLIDAIGTTSFEETVLSAFRHVAGVVEVFAFHRPDGGGAPVHLLSAGHGAALRAAAYCSRYYRLDPLNDRLSNFVPSTLPVHGMQISRDEIMDSRYRQDCYGRPGFAGKLALVARSPRGCTTLSLFRAGGDGPYQEHEVAQALETGLLLLPILNAHHRMAVAASNTPSVDQIEVRLRNLLPALTPREVAICARTVIGMTAEGIALELGIKRSSVLTYRRRAYERLNISTALQLSVKLFGC